MKFDTILRAFSGHAWGLDRLSLEAMAELLDQVIKSGQLPEQVAALFGGDAAQDDTPYTVQNGVALVSVTGTLAKRDSWGCLNTYGDVRQAVGQALDDPTVRSVLLVIDSPGGTVDGCQETAEYLARAGEQKPLYAFADGQATSAAYWLASAAREIAAPPNAVTGSIGVVTVHYDRSGQDQRYGVKRTYLTAGKYKATGHDAAPLSDEDRAQIQTRLDGFYDLFVQAVAANRGLSPDAADTWADGRLFLAKDAQTVGLIDHVEFLDAFLARIQANQATGQLIGRNPMDVNTLRAQYPDLVRQIEQQALASAPDAQAASKEAAQAAKTETLALAKHVLGDEAATKLTAVSAAGLSSGQIEALKASGLLAVGQAQPPAPAPATAPPAPDASVDAEKAALLAQLNALGAAPVNTPKTTNPEHDASQARINGLVAGAKAVK